MRQLKVALLLACFIFGMSLVIEHSRPSSRVTGDIKDDVIDEISLRTYQKIRNSVVTARHLLHEELKDDGKLLYMSPQSANWRSQHRMFSTLDKELNLCLELLEGRSSLYVDISTTQRLIQKATEHRDLQALVDAYNILSDLENFFFYHYRNEVYHGVTETLAGEVKYKTEYLKR